MEKLCTYYLWCTVLSVIIMLLRQTDTAPVNIWRETNRNRIFTEEREGNLFEGDIILSVQEQRELLGRFIHHKLDERMAIEVDQEGSGQQLELTNRWPGGRVPFKMDDNLDTQTRTLFENAIEHWTSETCLQFDAANANDADYIHLLGSGCSSAVGRTGGPQNVKIGKYGCTFEGNAIHELGHAIGLWHEHTRPDRDHYIKIYWNNIDKTDKYYQNFERHEHPLVPDVGYDIASIMHYGPKAFSADEDFLYTIDLKKPPPSCMDPDIMGQRNGLSFKDKLRVNLMYNCTDHLDALWKNIESCLYTPIPEEITPEPTVTEPPTECKETKNIESGTPVRLQFYHEPQKPDPNTVYCQRTCKRRTNCMVDPSSTCSEEQFQIFLVDQDRKNKKVKVGDLVAFRSMFRTLDWMDCSREACELTYCSHGSICLQHQFEIHRENQRTSSRIQTRDKVYLKAVGEDKYLNCAGTQCRLVAECEGSAQGSSSGESGSCGKRQLFSITKELECNDS